MSVKIAREALRDFLASHRSRAIVIKGAWGVGKTYFWKSLLADYREVAYPRKYAYVSLFGLSTADQVREAILVMTRSLDTDGGSAHAWKMRVTEWAKVFGGVLKGIPYIGAIKVDLRALAPLLINQTLVCIDDFERTGGNGAEADQILGYLTQLIEIAWTPPTALDSSSCW